ncbi:hypothetical protein B0I35DRAFT_364650 [Stachybotrys elegans]|uniref:Uncharacterized protein n=1 Tax=Stachybotrys elegans TaxID=80388 RepID=A0A8K0WIW3_9HYPO|nr:hypothetical protein B0I35DRAFT_364650 [Stachybotrys elegans]
MESTDLIKDGFIDLGDSSMGSHFREFEQKNFPFRTEEGIDFLSQHFLNNEEIRSLIGQFFGNNRCVFAHCLRYSSSPGHLGCFVRGNVGQSVLVVQLLSKGSELEYYSYSHTNPRAGSSTKMSGMATIGVDKNELDLKGCRARKKEFDTGALVVFDGRLCVEFKQGFAINVVFVTEDIVSRYHMPPMRLPYHLKAKVEDLQRRYPDIKLNFDFEPGTLQ